MFKRFFLLVLGFMLFTPNLALALNSEMDLKAVFMGRFSSFITWPEKKKENFVITIIDNNPFESRLDELYKNKELQKKSVEIRYLTPNDNIEKIKDSDIVFITIKNPQKVKEVVDFATKNSILTVSDNDGFAERGGIIQIDFVMQKVKLKINNTASKDANIKISSSLLNISEVIGEKR